jgi:hypothetical protein
MRNLYRICSFLLCLLPPFCAAVAQELDTIVWTGVTDGSVTALAHKHNTLHIGGNFRKAGPATGGGAVINPATSQLLEHAQRINGSVNTVIPDGRGGWFIRGKFIHVGRSAQQHIAHILPDNSVDLAWKVQLDGEVQKLFLHNNTLFVSGEFSRINGQDRYRLASLEAGSGQVSSWTTHSYDGNYYYIGTFAVANDVL